MLDVGGVSEGREIIGLRERKKMGQGSSRGHCGTSVAAEEETMVMAMPPNLVVAKELKMGFRGEVLNSLQELWHEVPGRWFKPPAAKSAISDEGITVVYVENDMTGAKVQHCDEWRCCRTGDMRACRAKEEPGDNLVFRSLPPWQPGHPPDMAALGSPV